MNRPESIKLFHNVLIESDAPLTETFKFILINNNDVSPLQDIEAIFLLDYENYSDKQKRTVKKIVEGLVTGTPTINYLMSEPNTTTVKPGQKMDFTIDIILMKMRSPLEIEVNHYISFLTRRIFLS